MKIVENIVKVWPIYRTLEKGRPNIEIPKELVLNYVFSDLVFFVILLVYDIFVLPINFPDMMGKAILFYAVLPTVANVILTLLFYLLHLIGKKYAYKSVGHKQWYIICGSLTSSLICFFPAMIFKASRGSVVLLVLPFIMATFFSDEAWLIWSSVFTLIAAALLCSGHLDFGQYEMKQFNPALDIMITVLCITFVFFVCSAMFFLKTVHAVRSEEANNRNKSQTAFFTNMSHEIRTPINAILGLNEMISREAENADIKKYSADIQSAGDSLLSLVNNVLDFSKIESGKFEIIEDTYDLAELIRSTCLALSAKAQNKGLSLTVYNDPNIPGKLFGDMGRIRQILINLISNSIKYTEKGSVSLKIMQKNAHDDSIDLVAVVEDTGVGIAEDDIEKLFMQFERIDEKRNRNIEGTGLGLPLTKQLLTLMNGTIDVKSTVGKGSVFTVCIPQTVKNFSPVGDFNTALEKPPVKETYMPLFTAPNANILVVDDVSLNLTVFAGLTKGTKVHMHTANDGFEALAKACEQHFDLIFMDHLMPKMDGIETLGRLRKECAPNFETPVIVLTANAVRGLKEEYDRAGFADYLTKPVSGQLLEQTMLKYLPSELVNML